MKEQLSILSVVAQQDIFNSELSDVSPPHRIIDFDTDQYFCCSNHRMFVEKNEKSVSQKIKDKVHEAKWFIKAVETRNKNVSKIGTLICEKQIKFLTKTSIDPEPLSGKEIAKELNLSTSTVSRIIRAKYIQYDDGLLPMKSLLAPSVSKSKKITSRNLIREIDLLIKSSQKRLSDQMITNLLNKKGYGLARRTINKYRQKSIRLEVSSSKIKTLNERN